MLVEFYFVLCLFVAFLAVVVYVVDVVLVFNMFLFFQLLYLCVVLYVPSQAISTGKIFRQKHSRPSAVYDQISGAKNSLLQSKLPTGLSKTKQC